MKLTKLIKTGPAVAGALITGNSLPLVVGWYITYRCNRVCDFCGLSEVAGDELDTNQVFAVIDRLADAGTKIIVFSGGEPLLRDDIGPVINHAKSKKISVGITSNGTFVKEKIDELAAADHVKLSFEGPKEIHDRIRGDGSYEEVMAGAEALKSKGVNVLFNATVCSVNIHAVKDIVNEAKKAGVKVKFQPVSNAHTMGKDIESLIPEKESFIDAIGKLRALRKTERTIANTDASLKYLLTWPNPHPLRCRGAGFFLRLDPAGRSFFCTMQRDNFAKMNVLEHGARATMKSLQQLPCNGCWCTSTLELNMFLDGGWKRPWQLLRFFS